MNLFLCDDLQCIMYQKDALSTLLVRAQLIWLIHDLSKNSRSHISDLDEMKDGSNGGG